MAAPKTKKKTPAKKTAAKTAAKPKKAAAKKPAAKKVSAAKAAPSVKPVVVAKPAPVATKKPEKQPEWMDRFVAYAQENPGTALVGGVAVLLALMLMFG